MKRIFLFFAMLFFCCIFLSGCRSTAYYQERAVERARDFLLEEASGELSANQIAYVKYSKPVLLVGNIFSGGVASHDLSQICVTWIIPGKENVYMVYGVSELRMSAWYPDRLIRKTFPKADKNMLKAVAAARRYAGNSLYFDLNEHQYNQVRFAMPEIRTSNFAVQEDIADFGMETFFEDELAGETAMAADISEDMALLSDFSLEPETGRKKTSEKIRTQFSFVWDCGEPDRRVVVCGIADDDLSNFKVKFGGILTLEELNKHVTGTYVRKEESEKK